MPRKLQHLKAIFGTDSGPLGQLLAGSARQQALLQAVRELLPSALARQCQGAVIHGDTLVIFATSASWCTRLRFAAGHLPAQLSTRCGMRLAGLKLQLTPPVLQPSPRRRHQPISAQTARLLRATAESIPESTLRTALEQLASTQKAHHGEPD